jgi:hypothetical protein
MFEVVSCRMGARQFDEVHASYPGSGRAALALHPQQRREVERRRLSELGLNCVWQGGQDMRIMTIAFVLGTALVLCNLGTFSVAAHAQEAKVVRQPRTRVIISVPAVRTTPYWDYYIVPRYRYRPEDDRVDPCGGPVVPVVRYGPQEQTVPLWQANALGLGRVHGRDWPCR